MADAPFDQDADGVGHELVGHLQDLVGQRGADQNHLCGRGQVAVHVVDLLLEPWTAHARGQLTLRAPAAMTADLSPTFVEHLVGLVQDQHLDGSGPEAPAADHVCTHTKVTPEGRGHAPRPHPDPTQLRLLTKHTSWGPRHHMLAIVQLPDVFTHVCPPDAGVTLDVHVVPQSQQHLWTDAVRATPTGGRASTGTHLPSGSVLPALWLEPESGPGSLSPADRKQVRTSPGDS